MKEDLEEKAKTYVRNQIPWYEQLSQSELLKMHIIRALNLNPEVLLLHRPVDQMEADSAAMILDVLRKQVDERGVFMPPSHIKSARPHTVIFTTGRDRERADSAADVADVVWHLSDKGFSHEMGGHARGGSLHTGNGTNKITDSWSKQVRSLAVQLDTA